MQQNKTPQLRQNEALLHSDTLNGIEGYTSVHKNTLKN